MPRVLVLVPPSPPLLRGATPIEPGYPRSYTAGDMRAIASDLDEIYRAHEEDCRHPIGSHRMDRITRRDPPVTPRDKELANTYDKFFRDPATGVRGSLGADGRVELDAGRHRAHYAMQQGVPVPVWVSSPDAEKLENFRKDCSEAIRASRPDLLRDRRNSETDRPEQVHPHAAQTVGQVAVERSSNLRSRPVDPSAARAVGQVATRAAEREPDVGPTRTPGPENQEGSSDRDIYRVADYDPIRGERER